MWSNRKKILGVELRVPDTFELITILIAIGIIVICICQNLY